MELLKSLSNDERVIYKTLLTEKIESFFDDSNNINVQSKARREEFDSLARTLRLLTPFNADIPLNGIAYIGRPQWLTQDLLQSLQAEATVREHEPLDRTDHFLGCGGELADSLSADDAVNEFIMKLVGRVRPTGIASYIYYSVGGSGIKPHVDTEVFSVNLMIMLKHQHPLDSPSSTTSVFPADMEPEHYRLMVGEAMVMHGSSTIHARTKVHPDERVHLLTIGFNKLS